MAATSDLVWLIQENQDDHRSVLAIKTALDALGVRWQGIEIELTSPSVPPIESPPAGTRLLCYGPGFLRRRDHGNPEWRDGCLFNAQTFRWSQFHRHWRGRMLTADGMVATVAELHGRSWDRAVFMRPDADSKVFDGGVRSQADIIRILERLDGRLELVIGSVTAIDAEYRVFIVGSEVVAASEYRREGNASFGGFVANDVVDFALETDQLWRPEDSYVLDVARSGGKLAIVEANCITAARHYGADSRAIVTALCRRYGSPR